MMKSVTHFQNCIHDRLHWNDFVSMINFAYDKKNPNGSNYGSKEIVGSVNFWHKLTMTIDLFSPEMNVRLTNMYEDMSKLIDTGPLAGFFAIISLTGHEGTTGRHTDPVDIAYWQCVGRAVWSTFDGEVKSEYELKPGDIICVGAGTLHEVRSTTPRAAVSFMIHPRRRVLP